MAVKVYNKLVRDKIPEIIKAAGGNPVVRVLSDEEFLTELNKKLQEEVTEYLAAENDGGIIEELADVMEVIHGIVAASNINFDELEKIRIQKKQKRGGFNKKIYLESVEESLKNIK